jgi:membrane protease YdiL (CAAX protease family)
MATVAIPGGLLTLWWLQRHRGQRLLPPRRLYAVPWHGIDVWFAFAVQLFFPALIAGFLEAVGIRKLLEGQDPVHGSTRLILCAMIISLPLEYLAILGELRYIRHAQLYQLGLTTRHALQNLIAGYLLWLLLTPLDHTVFALLTEWIPSEEHPFFRLVQERPTGLDLILVNFDVLFVAALGEELLFRGVLLPWLTRTSALGHFTVAGAALFTAAYQRMSGTVGWNAGPVVFVAALLPGYWLAPTLLRYLRPLYKRHASRPGRLARATRGIYGSALLFAAFHSSIWPSPIPLFFFALGLGWLAYRTQSLIGPMVAHGLFNAVSCLILFLIQEAPGNPNGRADTMASTCPSVVSVCKTVPGSWLPRRMYASPIAEPSRGENVEEVTTPTSCPSRKSLAPEATGPQGNLTPRSRRLTCPRSRAMTIGS